MLRRRDASKGASTIPCGGTIMTVLVTGGAGYIGSHMVLALIDAGEKRRRARRHVHR